MQKRRHPQPASGAGDVKRGCQNARPVVIAEPMHVPVPVSFCWKSKACPNQAGCAVVALSLARSALLHTVPRNSAI